MGLIDRFFGMVFGSGRNAVVDTVEVFRENAEKGAHRDAELHTATLAQFAQEFRHSQRSVFDRVMDALNRIPRPAMALGTLALFGASMLDPVWFASRMQGLALVPEPLWWLLGAIVSFYFGARHQSKGQEFQREIAQSLGQVRNVVGAVKAIDALDPDHAPRTGQSVQKGPDKVETAYDHNPALQEWRKAA